jgi:hypothetical protein
MPCEHTLELAWSNDNVYFICLRCNKTFSMQGDDTTETLNNKNKNKNKNMI